MVLERRNRPAIVRTALWFEGGLGLLAWLVGWWLGFPPLASFHWDSRSALVGLAACAPMLLFFWLCERWPVGPLVRLRDFSDQVIRPLFVGCTVPELALIALSAGVGEEMLFRGLLQTALTYWLGLVPGIALAALLFGLLHMLTLTYAVLAALLGLYLCVVWQLDGNLLSVILAHGLYDFVVLLFLLRTTPDSVSEDTFEELAPDSAPDER
jgi:membrane protease YdiL (CAAX protease family)